MPSGGHGASRNEVDRAYKAGYDTGAMHANGRIELETRANEQLRVALDIARQTINDYGARISAVLDLCDRADRGNAQSLAAGIRAALGSGSAKEHL